MEFKGILQRYHISPLKYDDDSELAESDYYDLAGLLLRYYYAKNILGCQKIPRINDNIIKRVQNHLKRSLFENDVETLMDILTEQTGGNVL